MELEEEEENGQPRRGCASLEFHCNRLRTPRATNCPNWGPLRQGLQLASWQVDLDSAQTNKHAASEAVQDCQNCRAVFALARRPSSRRIFICSYRPGRLANLALGRQSEQDLSACTEQDSCLRVA